MTSQKDMFDEIKRNQGIEQIKICPPGTNYKGLRSLVNKKLVRKVAAKNSSTFHLFAATCSECRHFQMFAGMNEGICHKGHGYIGATAQGLPEPEKGDAYLFYYDFACIEDFEAADEKRPGEQHEKRQRC